MNLPPYAELLGISTMRGDGINDGDDLIWVMPFREEVIGRPGFLHGGAIAGLLEFAALGTLYDALGDEDVTAKPINVTVDFMRGGADHETYATAAVTRLGKRVANVESHAWQQDRSKPIAAARINLLLKRNPKG
ncbi:MAG: PaaI family thioesterase [Sphingosinicella sp.]|nr:PaaI family thioesterase [Sphingosinicella sp.]